MLKGMIIIWWGSLETIPPGWQHCDGTNGTPDLRFKFVLGANLTPGIGVTGGSTMHSHSFTGDGHHHDLFAGFSIPAGITRSAITSTDPATGTTDQIDGRPPFHILAYIMKMFDDANSQLELPWPYAAKAIIQHQHRITFAVVWITFRHKMDIDVKPPDAKWIVRADGLPKPIFSQTWLDPWTMQLIVPDILTPPRHLTVEYDGPDENLITAWNKQWEAWGEILSFVHPSAPVTIQVDTGPAAIDDLDVTGVDIILIDSSGNDITIGGFVGGVRGQILHIAKLLHTGNNVTLEDHEGTGNQDIHLHAQADETLVNEHGGWVLVCNGVDWYDTSHSKHV